MQLKIYLNGDGTGKGRYVSLFFMLLQSSHDDILTWPFKQKVKLMAMDQSGRGEHVVDAFRPDPASSSFRKPTSHANIATGCPLFLPLNLLSATSSDGGAVHIKDDAMFVRAMVDKSGLEDM